MGLNAFGIFQARVGGRWVDVPAEVDPDDNELRYWLAGWLEGAQSCRGFPEQFEVVDRTSHPISDDAVRSPEYRRSYPAWHYLHGKVILGDHAHSWLAADEILSHEAAEIARLERQLADAAPGAPGDAVRAADDLRVMRDFFAEVLRLQRQYGQARMVFGVTY